MEKGTPHHKLSVVRSWVQAGRVRATYSAVRGAARLGLEMSGMAEVLMALVPADFYKSMTTHTDHTMWQDVYRVGTRAGDVYLKLTIVDELLIVSFKEL